MKDSERLEFGGLKDYINENGTMARKDFISIACEDAEVVFYSKNIFVVKTPIGESGYIGRHSYSHIVKMFDVKTGEEIKKEQLFKTYDDSCYYNMLMSAYRNNDKNLIETIEELKILGKDYGGADTAEDVIRIIADKLKDAYIWVSNKEGNISIAINEEGNMSAAEPNLLNFEYYLFGGPRYLSIDLENVAEHINMSILK